MKKITLSLLFSILCSIAVAQNSTKEILDKFFDKWEKDEMAAIDYAFSTSKYINAKDESIINLKNKLKNVIDLCGKYKGYEPLAEAGLGQCLKSASFIVKYERQPIRIVFLFYSADSKWVVQDFSFDTSLDADIEQGMKERTIGQMK